MKTYLHKNAYISKLLCKMQQKKNNIVKVYLHFFRNQNSEELFLNVSIALRIYSCMAVTNYSAERSFSCLKRTKTYLRSNISENRLNSLALLFIESELVSTIDFQDLIDTFANLKIRMKIILYLTIVLNLKE
jgi:hypothetical protein